MKIGLIGYGKMGQLVEKIALQRGHQISCKGHPKELFQEKNDRALRETDLFIDFSHPDAVLGNVTHVSALKKNLVVGTTGWQSNDDAVRKILEESKIGFLFSPNFSLGIHFYMKIIAKAAELFNGAKEYDVALMEQHHNQKVDSPSGTALAIARELMAHVKRKEKVVHNLNGQIAPNEMLISSTRCGAIPGTHTVLFDSPADTIEITHRARNREGLAHGAVVAAEWLKGKSGIYTLEDLF